MMEVGRLCVKISGREALKKCVVVKVIDENFVMIDGQVKRRKCNVAHLEPLDEVIKIKENASTAEVKKAFAKLKIEIKETKPKKAKERPRKVRKSSKKVKKEKPKKEKPKAKKEAKEKTKK